MGEKNPPHYDLQLLKRLFRSEDTRRITVKAQEGAVGLGYMDVDAIQTVIEKIIPEDFHKTMPAEKCPGLWQDVYKVDDGENRIYIKMQLSYDGKKAVLIQFKIA